MVVTLLKEWNLFFNFHITKFQKFSAIIVTIFRLFFFFFFFWKWVFSLSFCLCTINLTFMLQTKNLKKLPVWSQSCGNTTKDLKILQKSCRSASSKEISKIYKDLVDLAKKLLNTSKKRVHLMQQIYTEHTFSQHSTTPQICVISHTKKQP